MSGITKIKLTSQELHEKRQAFYKSCISERDWFMTTGLDIVEFDTSAKHLRLKSRVDDTDITMSAVDWVFFTSNFERYSAMLGPNNETERLQVTQEAMLMASCKSVLVGKYGMSPDMPREDHVEPDLDSSDPGPTKR